MKSTTIRLTLFLAGAFALITANQADAGLVTWDVDASQSFMRLAIPDQTVTVDTTTATIRIRDSNNNAWSDAGGRRAFLDGTISGDLVDGSSISFNGGMNNLFALQAGSFRPNPAQFDPNAIDADNPDGKYTGSGGAPAALAAKVRGSVSFLTLDLAYIAFRNVFLDIASGTMPLAGGTTFGTGSSFGIQSAVLDVDGLNATLVGQVIPDILSSPLNNLIGANVSVANTVTVVDALTRKLTYIVNVPIAIDLDGTIVNATASGQIVAFAVIPEPSSVLLASFAAVGLFVAGRRRLRRA